MPLLATEQRYVDMCKALGFHDEYTEYPDLHVTGIVSDYSYLVRRYDEHKRYYHTLEHIDECLLNLDWVRKTDYPVTSNLYMEAALWFHDIVYDAGATDNEFRSSRLMQSMLEYGGVSEIQTDVIAEYIMDTQHKQIAKTLDGQIIQDIDLAGLGSPYLTFKQNDSKIVKEFRDYLSSSEFDKGRVAFFTGLLKRNRIYCTRPFYQAYEEQARKNITRILNEEYKRYVA